MLHLYGIPNCDVVKKAVQFLNRAGVPFLFHNFKEEPLDKEQIAGWCKKVPFRELLNKRSTAWKLLSDEERQTAETLPGAVALMAAYNNLLKRPVAEIRGLVLSGFNEPVYSKNFVHD